MLYLDMRLCIVGLINLVKPPKFQIGGEGGGVTWEVMTKSNLFTFVLVLSTFSFVSIKVPPTLTVFRTRLLDILLRFGNCMLFVVVSFMDSLTSQQALFWYTYPVILLLFYLPTDRFVEHALRALEAVIPIRIPNIPINQVYDILINATVGGINEPHQQQQDDEPNSETLDFTAKNKSKIWINKQLLIIDNLLLMHASISLD